jgi:hypothetical protein
MYFGVGNDPRERCWVCGHDEERLPKGDYDELALSEPASVQEDSLRATGKKDCHMGIGKASRHVISTGRHGTAGICQRLAIWRVGVVATTQFPAGLCDTAPWRLATRHWEPGWQARPENSVPARSSGFPGRLRPIPTWPRLHTMSGTSRWGEASRADNAVKEFIKLRHEPFGPPGLLAPGALRP